MITTIQLKRIQLKQFYLRCYISTTKDFKINEKITYKGEVKVIDEEGAVIGLMGVSEALKTAKERNLDIVEVVPNASPPVCKIMDYGKYKYHLHKKMHDASKKQKQIKLKEIRIRTTTADGDLTTKLKSAKSFLGNGDKVRVMLTLRGRELAHKDEGMSKMLKFKTEAMDFADIESEPKFNGKNIIMLLQPK